MLTISHFRGGHGFPWWVVVLLLCHELRLAAGWSGRTWRAENGLPDGTVTALAQTLDGHVWVGTRNGLVRFDGSAFTEPSGDSSEDEIVRRSGVDALLVDRSDTLWVLSRAGALARVRKGRMKIAHQWSQVVRPVKGYGPHWFQAHRMAEDATGRVWVVGPDFRLWVVGATGSVVEMHPPGVDGELRGCWSDASGTIWIVKGNSVARRSGDSWNVFKTARAPALREDIACMGREGRFWVAEPGNQDHERQLRPWDSAGNPGPRVDVPARPMGNDGHLTALMEDRSGMLWANLLWGGLHHRSPSGHWESVQADGPLGRAIVTALMEDFDGGIWVGTLGAGLHRIRPNPALAVPLPAEANGAFVTSVDCSPRGDLWMGTDRAGVFVREPSGVLHRVSSDGMPDNHIKSVLANPDNSAWIGSKGGVVKVTSDGMILCKPLGSSVNAMHRDRQGNVWMGSDGSLWRLESGDPNRLRVFRCEGGGLINIRAIVESRDGLIWVAAVESGIWRVNEDRLVRAEFNGILGRTDTRSLHADEEGNLWIGTVYGGLFRWDGGRMVHYGIQDGLRDDSIHSITPDDEGRLWFGSNNGVFGILRSRLVRHRSGIDSAMAGWHITASDGLSGLTCSGGGQPVAGRLTNGHLLIANMSSAAVIDTRSIAPGNRPPGVSIMGLTVDGRRIDPGPLPVEISSRSERIDFLYAAPNFIHSHTPGFEFRLEGLDTEWITGRTPNLARYSRLRPGKYRFRVRVEDARGGWQECQETLALTVIPAAWERTSVHLGAGSFLIVLAVGLSTSIQRRRHRQQLRMIEQERTRIARDLHDDLGSRLAEVVLLSGPGRKEFARQASASSHVLLIARKTREAMESLNEIIWAVNPAHDHLPQLLDHLCFAIAESCEAAGVRCWLNVPVGAPLIPLSAMVRRHTALAVREVVRNSLVHSGTREIWLDVQLGQGEILIAIRDAGSGFNPSDVRQGGNGLANLSERMRQIGGSVRISSHPGGPTLVNLVIPIPVE